MFMSENHLYRWSIFQPAMFDDTGEYPFPLVKSIGSWICWILDTICPVVSQSTKLCSPTRMSWNIFEGKLLLGRDLPLLNLHPWNRRWFIEFIARPIYLPGNVPCITGVVQYIVIRQMATAVAQFRRPLRLWGPWEPRSKICRRTLTPINVLSLSAMLRINPDLRC